MPAVSLLHLLHATTDLYKFHWAPPSEHPHLNVKSSSFTHLSQYLPPLHPQLHFPPWFPSLSSFLLIAHCSLTLIFPLMHTCKGTFYSYPHHFCCTPPVLEDLSKPRGRKSTFLPHQLAKPNVEKARLKALLLLMLTAMVMLPLLSMKANGHELMANNNYTS